MTLRVQPITAPDPVGLTFAGAILTTATGERSQPFVPLGYPDLPEQFADALPFCDHSGRELRRQLFFIFRRTDTGAWVQIAQHWLGDYLDDHVAASKLVWWVEQYRKFILTIREAQPILGRTHYSVREVIEVALDVIGLRGWVSRGDAHRTGETATASLVADLLEYGIHQPNPDVQELSDEIEAGHVAGDTLVRFNETTEIMRWLAEIHKDEVNDHKLTDYLHNLAVIASLEYVELRHVGLLCSAPNAYRDWMAVKAREATVEKVDPGRYYGLLDERVEADVFVDEIENRGENEYGVSLLVHMHVIPTGERLKWWTGEGLKLDEKMAYHVRMTIKKHSEWDGRKETTVSRVMEYNGPTPRKKKDGASGRTG